MADTIGRTDIEAPAPARPSHAAGTDETAAPLGSLTELVEAAGTTHASTLLEFVSPQGRQSVMLGELHARALRVAGALQGLGVRPGDRVTAQLTNRPESVILQFAVLMVGGVLAPVVPVFGAREVSQVLADAEPIVYVTQRSWNKFDYVAVLEEIPADQRPQHLVVMDGAPDGYLAWEDLEAHEPLGEIPVVDEDARCLVIYTSGSTGMPKGVQHSRATLFAEAVDYDYRPHADSSIDVYLQGSASGHIGGYMYPLRAALYDMRTLVMDGWNADLACRLVQEEKVTAMVTTPFHAVAMLELAEGEGHRLDSIDMMMSGGAPVSPELVRRADAVGVVLVRAYGMSEHPTVAIGRWTDDLETRALHDGYLTGDNVVRLVDDDGNVVPHGSSGEIQVRGPEQFLGYTNVPDSEAFTPDGWFPTGDIGTLDDDGLLTIVDRKKNIIIRGGENLSATEIENVVAAHPDVVEVAVLGVPDPRYGERVCAFVVLRNGASLTLADLKVHFGSVGVARQKIPEFLEFVTALPRTGTGKIRKHELARLHGHG